MEPVARNSPFTNSIYKTCLKLYQVAESLVSGGFQQAQIRDQPTSVSSLSDESLIQDVTWVDALSQEIGPLPSNQDFVSVQDWNSLVNSFGADLGGDMVMYQAPPGAG